MKRMFKVDGMKCMGCVANVKKALESLEGVKFADVDLEAALATVEGPVAAEDVSSALTAVGYLTQEITG
jgi:Cu+-exporting ATPase